MAFNRRVPGRVGSAMEGGGKKKALLEEMLGGGLTKYSLRVLRIRKGRGSTARLDSCAWLREDVDVSSTFLSLRLSSSVSPCCWAVSLSRMRKLRLTNSSCWFSILKSPACSIFLFFVPTRNFPKACAKDFAFFVGAKEIAMHCGVGC